MSNPICSNTHPCTCPNTQCANHGRCCECIARHQPSGTVPNCYNSFHTLKRTSTYQPPEEQE